MIRREAGLLSGAPGLSNRSDGVRRAVHLLAGGCAFLLGPLGPLWGASLAAAAVVYNAAVAPSLGLDRAYRREGEGRWGGLTTYPLSVLALVLFVPLEIAAGAWAVLAAADPVAAAVGTRVRGAPVPWNPSKSLAGAAAGALAGALACFAVLRWMGVRGAFLPALTAGIAGAAAEAFPAKGDDNLRIAGAAAVALAAWLHPLPLADGYLPLLLVAACAALAYMTRATTASGTWSGVVVGTAAAWGLGWRGVAMLATLLVVGTVVTARERRGRGAAQVFCNGGVAAASALFAAAGHPWGVPAFAGALAAALSDTVAGEVGLRLGLRPRMLLFGPPCPPGSDGGMTWAGTAAGALGAILVPAAGGFPAGGLACVAGAGFLGNLVDSALGRYVQPRLGQRGNDITNLVATACGALSAATLSAV
jgi:uncharacterized protein (TIGR00297 family)